MTSQIRFIDSGGTTRTIGRIRFIDSTGVTRTIQRVRFIDSTGTTRTVYAAFSAVVTPSSVSGTGTSPSFVDITSSNATAVAVGGTAPFTYAWELLQNNSYCTWTINSPTAQQTNFTANDVYPGDVSAIFRVTITDAGGLTATADVEVTCTNTDTS